MITFRYVREYFDEWERISIPLINKNFSAEGNVVEFASEYLADTLGHNHFKLEEMEEDEESN